MTQTQTDEQERRQQKISLERFFDQKRLRDATRTSREGFQSADGRRATAHSTGPL